MAFMKYAVFFCLLFIPAAHAAERQQIRIQGSSTVYPFVAASAEQFGQMENFRTPIVEANGTGGGFRLFCAGLGADTPDMNNASRRITPSEVELCRKNGVNQIVELPLGLDGIVLANGRGNAAFHLTRKQIFLALARQVPDKQGKLVDNFYHNWREIDANLPSQPISVYGPPPTEGTRDAFVELIMEPACEQIDAYGLALPDAKTRKKACAGVREDGVFVEAGGNYNLVVKKLTGNAQALGIMGYGFYSENRDKIQASSMEGEMPSDVTIRNQKYPVARVLYTYLKGKHVGKVPGLAEFAEELTSERAIGEEGYLTAIGLLPLPDEQRKAARQAALNLGH